MPHDRPDGVPVVTDPPSAWRALLELVLLPFRVIGLLVDLVFLLLVMAVLLGIAGVLFRMMWRLLS